MLHGGKARRAWQSRLGGYSSRQLVHLFAFSRARPGGSCNFGTISARFYVGASYEEGSFCGAVHAPSILYPEY